MIDRLKIVAVWVIIGLIAWYGYRFIAGPGLADGQGLGDAAPPLIYNLIWLSVLIPIFIVNRPPLPDIAKGVALWGGLALVLVAGYAYRDDMRRAGAPVLSALIPGYAASGGDGTVVLNRSRDGHFRVNAQVNGADLRLLVDTGASTVVLTQDAARAAGIDPERLRFSTPITTANGLAFAAPVRLDSVAVGDIVVTDIEAMVAQQGRLGANLLGMSFLGRLSGYAFGGDRLVLSE